MKVATYNIHQCKGTDGRSRPDRIIGVLKEIDAEVVALQEADRRFGPRIGLLDLKALHEETGLRLLAQSDALNGHGWHGNALLVSRDPVSYHRTRIRLPGVEPRGAIIVDLDFGDGPFRIIAAHFGLLRRSRLSQAGALVTAFGRLPPMPTVLLGDLNEWRTRRGSSLNVFEPLFGQPRLLPSFPSRRPIFPLDRIFGWPRGLIHELAVHDTPLARTASDHLPLTARVDLTGQGVLLHPVRQVA